MRAVIWAVALTTATASVLAAGGCCKLFGKKGPDLDVIPGMKGSGIPDVHAAKEHRKEIEKLGQEIEELARKQQEIVLDPTLSPAEKERRIREIQKEMEPKVKRMAELGGDILNREREVGKGLDEWRGGRSGK